MHVQWTALRSCGFRGGTSVSQVCLIVNFPRVYLKCGRACQREKTGFVERNTQIHGLIICIPVPSKSETFLVTRMRLCRLAVAAINESANGNKWLYIGSTQVNMSQNAYVGLAVTSHNDGVLSTATFDSVKVYNDAGKPLVITDATPASFPLVDSVGITDKFYSVSGLAVDTGYTVALDNLSDNADLHVYTDVLFGTPVCPVPGVTPSIPDGTTAESCVVTSTATGQIFIRVNGSYSASGASFTLDVQ